MTDHIWLQYHAAQKIGIKIGIKIRRNSNPVVPLILLIGTEENL